MPCQPLPLSVSTPVSLSSLSILHSVSGTSPCVLSYPEGNRIRKPSTHSGQCPGWRAPWVPTDMDSYVPGGDPPLLGEVAGRWALAGPPPAAPAQPQSLGSVHVFGGFLQIPAPSP